MSEDTIPYTYWMYFTDPAAAERRAAFLGLHDLLAVLGSRRAGLDRRLPELRPGTA